MIFGAYLQETANNMREGLKMVRNLALAKKLTQTQVHMRVLSRMKNRLRCRSDCKDVKKDKPKLHGACVKGALQAAPKQVWRA